MVEDVWGCYSTQLEPLPSLEWWKTSETATVLGRNYYQVWNGGKCLRLLRHSVGTTTKFGIVEDVWDCYGTRSEPILSLEWWKMSETAMALAWNYYQVWKMSGTATALDQNYYLVWNGGRCLKLLRHSVGTTIKYRIMEDVRDCYRTRSEPLPNATTGGRDYYGTRPRSFVELRWLNSWSIRS